MYNGISRDSRLDGPGHLPFTQKIAGSNPAYPTILPVLSFVGGLVGAALEYLYGPIAIVVLGAVLGSLFTVEWRMPKLTRRGSAKPILSGSSPERHSR